MRMVKTIQLVTFCSAAIVWQTPTYAAQSNDRFVFVGYGDVKYESDIHYFVNNNTTITAGKFLLPFGQFSANWHPSWINRSI